jgi:hypothetical protein
MNVNPVSANSVNVNAMNRAELSMEDFWQLLLTHLQMQDPFETADMNQMLQQFVTLQAARETARVSDALHRLQALLMLGRVVSGEWEGEAFTGTVVGVSLSGTPTLSVKVSNQNFAVPASAVWQVALSSESVFSTQA